MNRVNCIGRFNPGFLILTVFQSIIRKYFKLHSKSKRTIQNRILKDFELFNIKIICITVLKELCSFRIRKIK